MNKLRLSWNNAIGAVILVSVVIIGGPMLAGNTEAVGCGGELSDEELASNQDHASPQYQEQWQQFKDSVHREPGEHGRYIVDFDIALGTEAQLQAYFDQWYARDTGALTVTQIMGADNIWSDADKFSLSYCVSDDFGADKDRVVAAMLDAASSWSERVEVAFPYIPGEDDDCDENNNNVVFDVRPAPPSETYFASAFFPHESRVYRSVLISESGLTTSSSGRDLQGIMRHELGHALGFKHEHVHLTSNPCTSESVSGRQLTTYDENSVMHYPQCRTTGTGGYRQTELDFHGAMSLYGTARWTTSGGRNMHSSSNPRFVLALETSQQVELNLMSNVDTYLYLLDQNGHLISYDDDGGVGLDSRLNITLTAGQYILVAATYHNAQSGTFTLTASHGTVREDRDAATFEPLDYGTGQLAGKFGSSERGLTGTWSNVGFRPASVVASSLSYPSGTFTHAPQGNKFDAYGNGGGQGAFARNFTAPLGDSEGAVTRWFSVLIQPKGAGSYGGFNGLRIYGNAGSDIFLGWGKSGADRAWSFDRFGGGSAGDGISDVSIASSLGQTVLLVGRIDFSGDSGPDRLSLFINPGSSQPAYSDAVTIADDINYGDLTQLGLQWNFSAYIDEIRVAQSYANLADENAL